jgi:hypothetical protein
MAQISFSLNGDFWPTSLPLFHGSWWDLLLESSMMNSLKLKGIQLSCFLTRVAILIVSFGAASLRFQVVIKKDKRTQTLSAWLTLWCIAPLTHRFCESPTPTAACTRLSDCRK